MVRVNLKNFWQKTREKLKDEARHPHKVALGAAVGVGVSFIPLPGMGAIMALAVAWLVRGSIPAALVSQVIGNPWTFPFIWAASLAVGKIVLPVQEGVNLVALMNNLTWQFFIDNRQDLLMNILVPMGLGGLILGFIFALLTYAVVLWELRRWLIKHGQEAQG
ncbi:MAG: DUF2062 domain-containing protein [Proteobacteria bacterium]|nr:DUF2062 domain-containing protein [Pseudomonadota bacterium]NBX86425.1 DUF2062 domain-containing protein [Pseudomonadota bacterium]